MATLVELAYSNDDAFVAPCVPVCLPWEASPFDLLTWWDMEQFTADAFFTIGRTLAEVQNGFRIAGVSTRPLEPNSHQEGSPGYPFLMTIKTSCRAIGLNISARGVDYFLDRDAAGTLTIGSAIELMEQLKRTITWEMQEKLFLYVPPERATFYGKNDLFGADVGKQFQSTQFDIQEAGSCLAVSRFTGCVFHLMRVLELGLTALGKVFGVSLAHTNWAPAIEQIESKIRDMHKDPTWKALPDCKEQQEFYAQAASHFGVLKDAWRNYTAHARGKYTEEEAALILANTRAFMQKLSARLKE